MKTKVAVLVASFAVLLFTVVGGLVGVRASSNDGAYRQLQVYSEVLSRVRSEYVEDPKIPTVTEGALHGLLESLDANSSYLSADEYKEFKQIQSGGKAGIGAAVSKRFGYAAVISVIPGGPADKAGLVGSDIIEAIEGKSTRDMSLAEIRSLLGGETGSTITVSVVRPRRAEPQKIVDYSRHGDYTGGFRQGHGRQRRLHQGRRVYQGQISGGRKQDQSRTERRSEAARP